MQYYCLQKARSSTQLIIRYGWPCTNVFTTETSSCIDKLKQRPIQVWCSLDQNIIGTASDRRCERLEHVFLWRMGISSRPCELTHSNHIRVGCSSHMVCSNTIFIVKIYKYCWYLLHIFCQIVQKCNRGDRCYSRYVRWYFFSDWNGKNHKYWPSETETKNISKINVAYFSGSPCVTSSSNGLLHLMD